MDVIAEATKYVNHGKVPVLTVYQPLFAIAKKIPWSWPDVYGDSKYVVMTPYRNSPGNVTICSDKQHEQIMSTIEVCNKYSTYDRCSK